MKKHFIYSTILLAAFCVCFYACFKLKSDYDKINDRWKITALTINGVDSLTSFKTTSSWSCESFDFIPPKQNGEASVLLGNNCINPPGGFADRWEITSDHKIDLGFMFLPNVYCCVKKLYYLKVVFKDKSTMNWSGEIMGKQYNVSFIRTN